MWVINPAVGCHYFPPGLQLPPQPLRRLLPVLLLGEQRHDMWTVCLRLVTRQRHDCDLNPGPFCTWVQHANHLATEPPSGWAVVALYFWTAHSSVRSCMHMGVPTEAFSNRLVVLFCSFHVELDLMNVSICLTVSILCLSWCDCRDFELQWKECRVGSKQRRRRRRRNSTHWTHRRHRR